MKGKRFKFIFFFLALSLFFVLLAKDFFRVTSKATAPTGSYQGGVWVDWNEDGLLDVFLLADGIATTPQSMGAGLARSNQLFLQKRDHTFRKINDDPLLNVRGGFSASTVGDFNNDGFLDLFITNGTSDPQINALEYKNLLFVNNGDGSFKQIVDGELVTENLPSVACSWGDYDDDGYLDLYICNQGTANSLFRNQGDGTFVKIIQNLPAQDENGYGCSWADFNEDGLLDLFVAHAGDQPCVLYKNEGQGIFTDSTPAEMTTDILTNTHNRILTLWNDFNNDGLLDLAIFPGKDEFPRFYKNNGDETLTKVDIGAVHNGSSKPFAAAWGDVDNDGDVDLFIGGKSAQSINLFYINDGKGAFSQLSEGMIVSDSSDTTIACKWWDFNNDGFLDLYITRWGEGNRLFQNRQQENNWLFVKCVGRQSNQAAIGSLVKVTSRIGSQRVTQMRLISAQPESDQYLHFGLADSELVEEVTIKWPSGHWQILANIMPNQRLTIYEEFAAKVLPPNHFKVSRVENSLLFFKEYINRLEWQSNPDNTNAISYYRLYRKSKGSSDSEYEFLSKVDGHIFYFDDKMLAPSQLFTYKITAVNQEGRRSEPVFASN